MDTFPIAWHRSLTALPGFYFASKKMKRNFPYYIIVEPPGIIWLSLLVIIYYLVARYSHELLWKACDDTGVLHVAPWFVCEDLLTLTNNFHSDNIITYRSITFITRGGRRFFLNIDLTWECAPSFSGAGGFTVPWRIKLFLFSQEATTRPTDCWQRK